MWTMATIMQMETDQNYHRTWLFILVKYKLARYHTLKTNTLHLGNISQLKVFRSIISFQSHK